MKSSKHGTLAFCIANFVYDIECGRITYFILINRVMYSE